MITKNIGMLLLAIYLIAVGILTLTGLGIGIITTVAGGNGPGLSGDGGSATGAQLNYPQSVTIDDAGILTDVHVVLSSPAFDAAALTAARSWLFADAERNGQAVKARAYLLFGFRQPVVGR